jgi:hypothetical protein
MPKKLRIRKTYGLEDGMKTVEVVITNPFPCRITGRYRIANLSIERDRVFPLEPQSTRSLQFRIHQAVLDQRDERRRYRGPKNGFLGVLDWVEDVYFGDMDPQLAAAAETIGAGTTWNGTCESNKGQESAFTLTIAERKGGDVSGTISYGPEAGSAVFALKGQVSGRAFFFEHGKLLEMDRNATATFPDPVAFKCKIRGKEITGHWYLPEGYSYGRKMGAVRLKASD